MDVETADALDRLTERIDRLEVSLRGDIVTERLRDDICLIAEGFAHPAVRFDRFHR